MKDLLDGIEDMGYIDKEYYEYSCTACGYEGDSCDYEVIQQEYDDEGNPMSDVRYLEKCPMCSSIFGF